MREKCSKRFFDNFHRFGHFVQKLVKMAIWLDVCTSLFKGWKFLKNLKVGVFETDLKQVQFAEIPKIDCFIFSAKFQKWPIFAKIDSNLT